MRYQKASTLSYGFAQHVSPLKNGAKVKRLAGLAVWPHCSAGRGYSLRTGTYGWSRTARFL